MTRAAKTFGAFLAEIEPNADREGVNCYISKGRYSASLECAADEGVLTSDSGDMPISAATVEAIVAWAQGHGY